MKLVYRDSGEQVVIGDVIKDFRGTLQRVIGVQRPHKPSSTGRVYLQQLEEEWKAEYFPGVINAHWIDREDQQ